MIELDETTLENLLDKLGLNAPRINPQFIDQLIVEEQFHVFIGSCMTVCCLTLKNGFSVIGESACASPENFNQVVGETLARKDARRKIWALAGYALKEKLWLEKAGATDAGDSIQR